MEEVEEEEEEAGERRGREEGKKNPTVTLSTSTPEQDVKNGTSVLFFFRCGSVVVVVMHV